MSTRIALAVPSKREGDTIARTEERFSTKQASLGSFTLLRMNRSRVPWTTICASQHDLIPPSTPLTSRPCIPSSSRSGLIFDFLDRPRHVSLFKYPDNYTTSVSPRPTPGHKLDNLPNQTGRQWPKASHCLQRESSMPCRPSATLTPWPDHAYFMRPHLMLRNN